MSGNDQRSKGQPIIVSGGTSSDVLKGEDYLPAPQQHPIRSWSDQTSQANYTAPPMSTMGVSDSFFQSYYPSNITYPFMGQGLSASEGPWSNGGDTMFGMGYDYINMYGGFGFPFGNWEYSSDYWGPSQTAVSKDQRGYSSEEHYSHEMILPEPYSVVNGTAVLPEQQEVIRTVEQGLRTMTIAPSNTSSAEPSGRKKYVDVSQPPIISDGFNIGESSHMSSHSHGGHNSSSAGSGGGSSQSKKSASWAAIASQPARPATQMRPRTIPRTPMNPNRPHYTLDIGTWDMRGHPAKAAVLSQPPLPPANPAGQTWTIASVSRTSRPVPPHSVSAPTQQVSVSSTHFNANNNSSSSGHSINPESSEDQSYLNYTETVEASAVARNTENTSSTITNGDSSHHSSTAPQTSNPVLDQLKSSNLYNPKDFNLNPKCARFFIIKSYSEDDIHRSIKYNIWCSTDHGNKRLDDAFREREGKGPVYLIYSVNGSGHFCGIAQMMTPVDYNKTAGVWAQDKWKGQFTVQWIYVKDVPNSQLRHIRLENNENKPVTNSRDTQEVPLEKGKQVLRIVHSYKHSTSIFDDFIHYEKRQEEDATTSVKQHRDGRNEGRADYYGGDREARSERERPEGAGRHRDNRRGGFEGGNRGFEGGNRGFEGGSRGFDGGSRGFEGGSRGVESGSRGFESGGRGYESGGRGYEEGVRGFDGGSRGYEGGSRSGRQH